MTYSKNSKIVDLTSRRRVAKNEMLEDLFTEHSAALRAFLAGRTRNEAEADDLLQEVFLRLARIHNLVEHLDEEKGNIRTFLFTTANHLMMDSERRKATRRKYRDNQAKQADSMVFEITPEVSLSASRDLDVIKKAILNLPTDWAKAFILNRFKHMSYQNVADEMNISVKTVEKYISRSLIELRNTMQVQDEIGNDS